MLVVSPGVCFWMSWFHQSTRLGWLQNAAERVAGPSSIVPVANCMQHARQNFGGFSLSSRRLLTFDRPDCDIDRPSSDELLLNYN